MATQPGWRDVIIRALYSLGGDAPYARLKPQIEMRGERTLTRYWHQTVEGTIEDFSSDSIRGNKPRDFQGGPKDIFVKLGHGHWGLRNTNNPIVMSAIETEWPNYASTESQNENEAPDERGLVFVREHWRRYPGDGEPDLGIEAVQLSLKHLELKAAWATPDRFEVEFANQLRISLPINKVSDELNASNLAVQPLEVQTDRVAWPSIGKHLTVSKLFLLATSKGTKE